VETMPLGKFLSRLGQRYPTDEELEEQGVKSERMHKSRARQDIPDAPAPERSYDNNEFPSTPPVQNYPQVIYQKRSTEEIQKLLERTLDEKFKDIAREIESVKKISSDISKLGIQLDGKFEKLSSQLDSVKTEFEEKLSAHDSSMSGLNVEFRALRKVFDNVMPVLTDNVKELRDIVEKLKK